MTHKIYGLDISHHNRFQNFDWKRVSQDNQFVICRSNYGVGPDDGDPKTASGPDVKFREWVPQIRDAGMTAGSYHFVRYQRGGNHRYDEQVEQYLEQLAIANWGPGDMYPVLDLEDDFWAYGADRDGERVAAPAGHWEPYRAGVEGMYRALVREYGGCIIYSYTNWYQKMFRGVAPAHLPAWFREAPKWYAELNKSEPSNPPELPWALHQYTWSHRGPGIDTRGAGLDHNWTTEKRWQQCVIPKSEDLEAVSRVTDLHTASSAYYAVLKASADAQGKPGAQREIVAIVDDMRERLGEL